MRWTQKPPLGVPINPAHSLARGLVACWLLNEADGDKIYDLGGYENLGTLTNMAIPSTTVSGWNPGKDGPAVKFDGSNDLVGLGAPAALKLPGPFSVGARVWLDSTHGDDHPKVLDWDVDTHGFQLYCATGGSPGYGFSVGDGSVHAVLSGVTTKDIWLDLVGVYDSTYVRIYVDGVQRGTPTAYTGTVSYAGLSVFQLGNRGGDARHWKGLIEYVYIWNRGLSAQEAQELYLNPYGMFDWPMPWLGAAVVVGNPWYAYAQM